MLRFSPFGCGFNDVRVSILTGLPLSMLLGAATYQYKHGSIAATCALLVCIYAPTKDLLP
jgi:hypothetical protein